MKRLPPRVRCDRNWFLAGRIIHLTYCSPFNLQILCLQKALEHIKQNIKQGDLISGELVGIKAVKSALIVLFCTSTPVFLEISSITIEGKSSRDKKFLAFVLAVHNIHRWISIALTKGYRSKLQPFCPLRWPIYVFNSVVNTKLPAVLSHRRSTTVSF